MMKHLVMVLAGICFVLIVSYAAFAQKSSTKDDYCTAKRKQCIQQYTRTNSHGVKYVTPEGTKLCWSQYRKCKGQ